MVSFVDMNEQNDTHPAPPERPKGWTRWSQDLLESVFATIAVGAIVVAVVDGLDTFTADTLERRVDLEDGAAAVDPSHAGDFRLAARSATLLIEDPSFLQRLAMVLPVWLAAATVGYVAHNLWRIARSLRDGDLFQPENVQRLRSSANIVLVGGLAAAAAHIGASLWFVESADGLPISLAASGSLLAVPVALALGGIAEIFRRGAGLRDDVAGLV